MITEGKKYYLINMDPVMKPFCIIEQFIQRPIFILMHVTDAVMGKGKERQYRKACAGGESDSSGSPPIKSSRERRDHHTRRRSRSKER